jgi:N-methylhydantoinase B
MTCSSFDAVTLEILWRRMISATDEAAKTLQRVSFSTLVNESNDFACVLTDATGASLVQNTESIPSFNGCLPVTVKHFLATIGPDDMAPGDYLICNDPWVGTGHLNDITIAKPVFRDGRLVAFCASTAHAPDIGGKVRSVVAREVFEEGFAIPAMHLIRDGKPDETFFKLLRAAVRTPDQTEGDLWAQITGLDLMDQRLGALMDEYELDDLTDFADEIHGRCETAMRAAFDAAPDGRYEFGFDTDGMTEPFHFQVAVTIKGDRAHVDWTGTSDQIGRAINCPFVYTFAMSSYALKCVFLPNLPNNEGVFRCIEVEAPEGSLVNPKRPVAVGGRMATGHYLPTAIFGALAQALPERVMAASGSPLWSIIQTGVNKEGKPYANTLFFNGGSGATAQTEGQSCYSWPSNISNVPIELTERNTPFFVQKKALRDGSGGVGAQAGGLGQEIILEHAGDDEIGIIFMAERLRHPAHGLMGGGPGSNGAVEIDGVDADARADHVLKPGQTITLKLPGGGGYGSG